MVSWKTEMTPVPKQESDGGAEARKWWQGGINILRLRQDGWLFVNNICKSIFFYEMQCIAMQKPLKFFPNWQ